MRWVKSALHRLWYGYLDSYNLDEEVRENNPITCSLVIVCFLICTILLWIFEPSFRPINGMIIIGVGCLGCVLSLLSWIFWRMRCRTISYVLQLLDSPLLGFGVLWAGITTPSVAGSCLLSFWVIMAQKWARQYAFHALSAISVTAPMIGIMLWQRTHHVLIIGIVGIIFFIITAQQTRAKRQLMYGRSRVSDVLRALEVLCERKIIQYHQFSIAMRRLREMTFILRSNALTLEEWLSDYSECTSCGMLDDIKNAAVEIGNVISTQMSAIDDGDDLIFSVGELVDAIAMRQSICVTLQGRAISKKVEVLADDKVRACVLRGDLEVVALAVHSLIDNALEAGALHVQVDMNVISEEILHIAVADNGRGIPVTLRRRIFEAGGVGNTRKAGMGLFFARQAVRFYGGDVTMVSTGPQGSVFLIKVRLIENNMCKVFNIR